MGVQDSLGNSEWGCRIPYGSRDSIFPEGMPNFLGNLLGDAEFTRGCRIPRGAVTPDRISQP